MILLYPEQAVRLKISNKQNERNKAFTLIILSPKFLFDMFADGVLEIFLAMLEIRYMLTLFAFDMDMRHLLAPQGISSCKATYRAVAISSDTKWHISTLKLLFAKTINSFNVGQDSKGYKNRSKTGVVKSKGIFLIALCP